MQVHPYWPSWHTILQKWGLVETAILALEACSPMDLIFAQMAYFTQPFIPNWGGGDQLKILGYLLEDPEEKLSFTKYLKEKGC